MPSRKGITDSITDEKLRRMSTKELTKICEDLGLARGATSESREAKTIRIRTHREAQGLAMAGHPKRGFKSTLSWCVVHVAAMVWLSFLCWLLWYFAGTANWWLLSDDYVRADQPRFWIDCAAVTILVIIILWYFTTGQQHVLRLWPLKQVSKWVIPDAGTQKVRVVDQGSSRKTRRISASAAHSVPAQRSSVKEAPPPERQEQRSGDRSRTPSAPPAHPLTPNTCHEGGNQASSPPVTDPIPTHPSISELQLRLDRSEADRKALQADLDKARRGTRDIQTQEVVDLRQRESEAQKEISDLKAEAERVRLKSEAEAERQLSQGSHAHEQGRIASQATIQSLEATVQETEAQVAKANADLGVMTTQKDAAVRENEAMKVKVAEIEGVRAEAESAVVKANERAERFKQQGQRAAQAWHRFRHDVWTFARIRPPPLNDPQASKINLTSSDPSQRDYRIVLRAGEIRPVAVDTEYAFERVLHESDGNNRLYDDIEPMVRAALDGYPVFFLLEGPSASGKSYTMFEPPNGLVFKIAHTLFSPLTMQDLEPDAVEVRVFNFKTYKDTFVDASRGQQHAEKVNELYLSHPANGPVRVYRDKSMRERIEGQQVTTEGDLKGAFISMWQKRDKKKSPQNEHSSRGHAVSMIELARKSPTTEIVKHSTIYILDLAGAESARDKSPDLKETAGIIKERNGILGKLKEMTAIQSMATRTEDERAKQRAAQKTFRLSMKDSKLTHILCDCLMGSPKILIIATMNPYAKEQYRHRIFETCEFVSKIRQASSLIPVKIDDLPPIPEFDDIED